MFGFGTLDEDFGKVCVARLVRTHAQRGKMRAIANLSFHHERMRGAESASSKELPRFAAR